MKKQFLLIALFLLFFPHVVFGSDYEFRFHYIGTTNIRFPTAHSMFSSGYVSDGSHNLITFAQPIIGKFLELSGARHLNGPTKDKNILNLKVTLLEEDSFYPKLAWGVSDFQEKLGSKVFYVVGSKNFEAFALTLHGGFIKDPVTTKKKVFYGIEKVILPLIIFSAESFEGNQSFGVKLRPYPGISIEYGQRDVNTIHKDSIYKVLYFKQM